MRTRLLALILLAATLLALTGCNGGIDAATLDKPADLIHPQNAENSGAVTAETGANDFAFRFSAELRKHTETENFVCSPFSVWLPLAALLNATGEPYKEELLTALGAAGISENDINEAASGMLYDFNNTGSLEYDPDAHQPLAIVNAIFVDQKETLVKKFAQTFLDCYRGELLQVDFSDPSSADAVNQWASDNTDGLIDNVVEQFDPETVAAIANAIYFSDRWNLEFDEKETVEDIFYGEGGETTAFYMLRDGESRYYEDNRVQMISLRFRTEGTMYVILPRNGDADGFLKTLDADAFNHMKYGMSFAQGKLLLPRFEIANGGMDLTDTLRLLEIPLLDSDTAPLTGGLIESPEPVWISRAVQKAMIKVDEKGTTAAAVTVMTMPMAGLPEEPPEERFEMICNTPFAFVLTGGTHGGKEQILFTGVVNNPEG